MNIKNFICYLVFLAVICISPSYPIVFIDIDKFDFLEENRRGIRVVSFDTNYQKYNYIGYLDYSFVSGKGLTQEEWLPWPNDEYQSSPFWISSKGNICIQKTFNPTKYFLRTYANIINVENQPQGNIFQINGVTKTILAPVIAPSHGNTVCSYLSSFSSDVSTPSFTCVSGFPNSPRFFSEIVTVPEGNPKYEAAQKASQRERGKLGELVTEMTMLSFGYMPLPSKNSSDQGFNGVWADSAKEPTSLFLCQSNCQQQKKSAEAYMNEDLNDEEIARKLKERTPPQTRTIIECFMREKPDSLYRLAQRLKKNGQVQSCTKKFDLYSYRHSTILKNISPTSSLEEKKQALEFIATQMNLAPNDMISLILNSSTPISQLPPPLTYISPPRQPSPLHADQASVPDRSSSLVYQTVTQTNVTLPNFFQFFSYNKLQKLIQLMNNDDGSLGHQKISFGKLGKYGGYSSNSNVKKVLKGSAPLPTAQFMWSNLISNFDRICEENNILKDLFLETCLKDPAFQAQESQL